MTDITNVSGQMKPNHTHTPSSQEYQTSVANEATANQQKSSISLSNNALIQQTIQQAIAEAPVVDKQRVAALKAAIERGEYQVDVDKLAQNLLLSELSLK
ncbi:MAG TPA: flagellar biosynthesis anti-sigma factor FlgM [Gammaproteobacteria bacterium]|nr:flagellar biosynthesis anti-sigma factor FlgM [Gammaproteobacteria bacterium]